jgi:serine/threonine protein kinase
MTTIMIDTETLFAFKECISRRFGRGEIFDDIIRSLQTNEWKWIEAPGIIRDISIRDISIRDISIREISFEDNIDNTDNIDNILLGEKLGKGTYGVVYRGAYVHDEMRRDCALKFCYQTCLDEFVTSIILYCLFDNISTIERFSSFQPFANIITLGRGIVDVEDMGKAEQFFSVSEKLDEDFFTLFRRFKDKDDHTLLIRVLSILIRLCDVMEMLQSTISFMHRDMYAGNIMIKGDYPKIIDLGMCSADLRFGGYHIDMMECKQEAERCYRRNRPAYKCDLEFQRCSKFNKGHDLRLLFSSLYFDTEIGPSIPPYLSAVFQLLFSDKKYRGKQSFHEYYDDVIMIDDVEFHPLSLKKVFVFLSRKMMSKK